MTTEGQADGVPQDPYYDPPRGKSIRSILFSFTERFDPDIFPLTLPSR